MSNENQLTTFFLWLYFIFFLIPPNALCQASNHVSNSSHITPKTKPKPPDRSHQIQNNLIPLRKPKIPDSALLHKISSETPAIQVTKCDALYKNRTAKEKDEIEKSVEYFQYKAACSNNEKNQTSSWKGKGPGDACILHTTLMAAKIFDIDFSLSKCMIIKETGDYKNAIHQLTEMYENLQVNPTYEIKINASKGNGNGLGQVTLPAYQDVMVLIDPTDLRDQKKPKEQKLSRKNFSCDLRHKWHTFFDLTNNGQIPRYKEVKIKDFHPLLSMIVGLTYLSNIVPKRMKQTSIHESIRFNSIDRIDDSNKSYKTKRLKQQIDYAGKYNSSYLESSYRTMVKECISKTENQYKSTRRSISFLANLNRLPSVTKDNDMDSTPKQSHESIIILGSEGNNIISPK